MALSANYSTKNPPRKIPRTNVIDISSNESSPIKNNLINTTLDTTQALTIPSPITGQAIPTQGIDVSPLAPRALIFSTSTSSPLEPHPYLTSLEDLPPRSSNPPPPSSSLGFSLTLPQQTPMDFRQKRGEGMESLDLNVENKERTRLRLFQFFFRDQASNWPERLPAGSISTWEDLTTRFLA
ncbi:hypothetical protein Tco_1003986 [Tanacetum coccineum]|uniref:Uncharacterized protein n=1 Tax=Tanacetum coccineum TaxID=301880 RepID=A0ABQ5FC12_9ASTR